MRPWRSKILPGVRRFLVRWPKGCLSWRFARRFGSEVQIATLAQPGVLRAVLKQHHARKRTPLALAPVDPAPRRFRRQPAQLQHALHPAVRTTKRLAVRHRAAHDPLVEVLGRKIEIPRAKHPRHPLRFRVGNASRTHPTAPTINQPFLAPIRAGVPQPTEMPLAQSQKLACLHTAQPSRAMRPDRIRHPRHPNLRQHAILRSKNRTNHVLPKPDISLATDTLYCKACQRNSLTLDYARPGRRHSSVG